MGSPGILTVAPMESCHVRAGLQASVPTRGARLPKRCGAMY